MNIRIGDVDITNELIDTQFRIGVLENLLEQLINANQGIQMPIDALNKAKDKVLQDMQNKYPNMGLYRKW